ncbi:hypothetical protein [Crossiella sp. NPDC003009]
MTSTNATQTTRPAARRPGRGPARRRRHPRRGRTGPGRDPAHPGLADLAPGLDIWLANLKKAAEAPVCPA